jgi:hypothetical protein
MHVPLWVLLLISFAFTALGMYAILAWFAMRRLDEAIEHATHLVVLEVDVGSRIE